MDLTIEEARALVADRALWPRVRDFLWDFAPQVHQSWLEGLDVLGCQENPRAKRFVLGSLGVGPCFHAFPKDDWSRLLLLDGATLESVARWLGAIVCAEELRHVTAGATVRALKTALPGVYPEVFGYTAYFKGIGGADAPRGDGRPLEESVVLTGLETMWRLVSGLPDGLLARCRLKLPKSLCDSPSLHEAAAADKSLQSSMARLFKLKFPEAYELCCS